MKIETMKIVCEENERAGYAIINVSDFAAETMVEYSEVDLNPITRADIAQMSKPELIKTLEAHEADSEGKVPELKERLIAVMFIDETE